MHSDMFSVLLHYSVSRRESIKMTGHSVTVFHRFSSCYTLCLFLVDDILFMRGQYFVANKSSGHQEGQLISSDRRFPFNRTTQFNSQLKINLTLKSTQIHAEIRTERWL